MPAPGAMPRSRARGRSTSLTAGRSRQQPRPRSLRSRAPGSRRGLLPCASASAAIIIRQPGRRVKWLSSLRGASSCSVRVPSRWQSSFSLSPLAAQTPAKRPLTYDVVDYWRSIQGTRLSQDGQWLAYALTAPGEDGELVVRNLKTNQEFEIAARHESDVHARRQVRDLHDRADEGRRRARESRPGRGRRRRRRRRAAARAARRRRRLAQLTRHHDVCPAAQVTTIEHVATFRLPEESSTWLAYHKARAGRRTRRRSWRRTRGRWWRRRTRRCGHARGDSSRQRQAGAEGENAANANEKRKDAGTDLIVRNLTTGQETTIPEVTEFAWNKTGAGSRTPCRRPMRAKDGAFVRQHGRRLGRHAAHGQGQLQEPRLRRRRQAARVPERPGGVRQEGLAVPALLLEDRRRRRDRARVGGDEGHARRAWS